VRRRDQAARLVRLHLGLGERGRRRHERDRLARQAARRHQHRAQHRQIAGRAHLERHAACRDPQRLAERHLAGGLPVHDYLGPRPPARELQRPEVLLDLAERLVQQAPVARDPDLVVAPDGVLQVGLGVDPVPERLLGQRDLRQHARRLLDGRRLAELGQRVPIAARAPELGPLLDEGLDVLGTQLRRQADDGRQRDRRQHQPSRLRHRASLGQPPRGCQSAERRAADLL